ncbi:MAG TPA: hypothetical protein VE152_08310, partial [Acidimicrobiales bacterium]|nr:hypothetical protein [Acidimicrobiales bacterium]
ACWGRETREAAIRFVTGMRGDEHRAANVEIKCFDAAANPYLVVGSLVAAGLAGVETGARLPQEMTGDPATRSPQELADLGVRRLPQTLTEAVGHLEASTVLRRAMGDALFDAVVAVRRAEVDLFHGAAPEAVATSTRWVH